MKRLLTISTLFLTLGLLPCCTSKQSDTHDSREIHITSKQVAFTPLTGYYRKSDYAEVPFSRITTAAAFRKYFGESRTAGTDSLPTPVDFEKEYVIAVTKPFTNYETVLIPDALARDELGNLVFTYRSERGEYRPFRMLPSLLIKIDKAEEGDIVLAEVK